MASVSRSYIPPQRMSYFPYAMASGPGYGLSGTGIPLGHNPRYNIAASIGPSIMRPRGRRPGRTPRRRMSGAEPVSQRLNRRHMDYRLRCFECRSLVKRKYILQKRPCRHLACMRCVEKYSKSQRHNCDACERETGQAYSITQWFCTDVNQRRFAKDISEQVFSGRSPSSSLSSSFPVNQDQVDQVQKERRADIKEKEEKEEKEEDQCKREAKVDVEEAALNQIRSQEQHQQHQESSSSRKGKSKLQKQKTLKQKPQDMEDDERQLLKMGNLSLR